MDAAAHQDFHAFEAVLVHSLCEAVEGFDAVPFGILLGIATLVLDHFSPGPFRTGGCQPKLGDLGAAACGDGFGVVADIAGEKNNVCHFLSPSAGPGDCPSERDPTKASRRHLQPERRPVRPQGKEWCGQARCANTVRRRAGLLGAAKWT